jgi:hypothetical protein
MPANKRRRKPCSVIGCKDLCAAKGLCSTHYGRKKKYGDPHHRKLIKGGTAEDRFWFFVERGASDECWEWKGSRSRGGYGRVWLGKDEQSGAPVRIMSHRFSYELHKGRIPDDLLVLHRCDNGSCCNPDHLFLGTHKDNVGDCFAKGRRAMPSAKLTPELVGEIREQYDKHKTPHRKLALQYGVGKTAISDALARKTWTEV